jgi:hypothetical protein
MPQKLIKVSFFFEGRNRDGELTWSLNRLCRLAESVRTDPRTRESLEGICQMVFAKSTWAWPKLDFNNNIVCHAFRAISLLDSTSLLEQALPLAFFNPMHMGTVLTMIERRGHLWLQQRQGPR